MIMTEAQVAEWTRRTAADRQALLEALPDVARTSRLLGEIRLLREHTEEAVKAPLMAQRTLITFKNGHPRKGREVALDMLQRELAAVERLFLLPGVWEAGRVWEDLRRRLASDPWCHVRPGLPADPHDGVSMAAALAAAVGAAPVCFAPAALTFWERIAGIARTVREEEARREELWAQVQARTAARRREMAAEIPGAFQESGPTFPAK